MSAHKSMEAGGRSADAEVRSRGEPWRTGGGRGRTRSNRLAVRSLGARALAYAVILLAALLPASAATLIYRTTFESFEGYNSNFTLSGQNNWTHEGSGGNGLVNGFIPGAGQSAYLGFTPPNPTEFTSVWRPVNLAPVPTNLSVVTFSVTMLVVDSTNGWRDDFRWSIYNTNGARLFSLDFDNSTEGINYALDDGAGFVATGFHFTRGAVHELAVTMNFPRNRWQASLDGFVLTPPLPLTTTSAARNLGDIDAVWAIRTLGNAGNNHLVFDNYQIAGEPRVAVPTLLSATRQGDGFLRLQVQAEQATRNAIEVSTNLTRWDAVVTNSALDGVFDVLDGSPLTLPRRFYRVRLAEP
ncbi:MAG: hypothetical protein RL514_3137 [Verrucomicrobiota bacterium]